MKHVVIGIAGSTVALFLALGNAVAAGSSGSGQGTPSVSTPPAPPPSFSALASSLLGPTQTGQPNQSCSNFPTTPGNSSTAPGSAFNPNGKAGTVYAGQQPQNSKNAASVAQYDVACSRQPPP